MNIFSNGLIKNFTKIVEFKMKPGKKYNWLWHVEGLSRKNIIATRVYFIRMNKDIKGGNLMF